MACDVNALNPGVQCDSPAVEREIWALSFGTPFASRARLCDKHYFAALPDLSTSERQLVEQAKRCARAAQGREDGAAGDGAVSH